MGNRSAKFISTLVASIIAGVPLAAVSQNAPSTPGTASAEADDCLASPKATAPQGQHWYYRIDRASKRKCWYLRAEGDKAAQTSTAQNAQPATGTADAEPAAPHTVQDARAEYMKPQGGAAPSSPNVTAPTPSAAIAAPAPRQIPAASADSNAQQQPAVTTRWPDASTSAAAPAPQPAAPPVTADAQPNANSDQSPAPQSPAPTTLATAEAPAKATGSLQTLMLVIGGALALAGIIGSVIYRFAGSRVRVQAADGPRRVNWDNWEQQDQDHSRAPWLDAVPARASRAQRPRPVDFDLAGPLALKPITIVDNRDTRLAHESTVKDERDGSELEALEAEVHALQLAAIDAHIEQAHVEETHVEETKAEETRVEHVEVEQGHIDEPDDVDADGVDIDVITQMLERLAKEGPRLTPPSPEADLADFAQSRRGQRAARA
ncbi:hypothetical protein QA641_25550 [Bradyrhizobium sp. CB1650]|uniref:hypothetical protein n=1 Tax=Bradyrhizobium sp. CB1650 TaxID=3039153 RepID=UPI0024355F75|nr:hypothetical protein [Bradyrhizobium sp. CB1650]WGD49003.1 hypothetical protein QA641_25550 [Bradyrhizobium sp. CB1650]